MKTGVKMMRGVFAAMIVGVFVVRATEAAAEESAPENFDYLMRFTFKGTCGESILQFSELAIYDGDGDRLNLNLTQVAAGTPVSQLEVGQFVPPTGLNYGGGETWDKTFDGDRTTKLCANGGLNFTTGVAMTMRLASAKIPVAYDYCSANDRLGRSPSAWILEISVDQGETWVLLENAQGIAAPGAFYTWRFGGNTADVSASPRVLNVVQATGDVPAQIYDPERPATPIPVLFDRVNGTIIENVTDYFDITYVDNDKVGTCLGTAVGKSGMKYAGASAQFSFLISEDADLTEYWVRFRFEGSGKEDGNIVAGTRLCFSELAIYDDEFNRLNRSLMAKDSVADLHEGQFAVTSTVLLRYGSDGADGWMNVFDNDPDTVLLVTDGFAEGPVELTMCLAAKSAPAYYDIRAAAANNGRLPTKWSVMSSIDHGNTWEVVAAKDGGASNAYTGFDPFPLDAYAWMRGKNNGEVSADPFTLDADAFSRLFMLAEPVPRQVLEKGQRCTPIPRLIDRQLGDEILNVTECFDLTYANNGQLGLASGTLIGKEETKFEGQSLDFEFEVISERRVKPLMRFIFKDAQDRSRIQLSELAVYNRKGERINLNLQRVKDAADDDELNEGEYSLSRTMWYADNEGPDGLFDGNKTVKFCSHTANYVPDDPSTWFTITMCLNVNWEDIAAYDFCTANDHCDRTPKTWSVEASYDGGKEWFEVDSHTNFNYPNETFTWLGGNRGVISVSPLFITLPKLQKNGIVIIVR